AASSPDAPPATCCRREQSMSALWPTPTAHDDNKSPEAHLAMKQRMGERDGTHANRTAITSLQVLTQQWQTPTHCDAAGMGGAASRADGRQSMLHLQTSLWQTPATDSFRHRGGD